MNVLIAFGTSEGQTRKISRHMAQTLEKAGHRVDVYDCVERDALPDVDAFDCIVVAGSVHQKRYQTAVYDFAHSHSAALRAKPSAFVSVSLSVTLRDGEEEAMQYVDDFAAETGWPPDHIHLAEGAIRYLEYDFFKTQIIEHVVLKGHKEMPKTDGNPEFTDWNALDTFVMSFMDSAAQAPAVTPAS